MKTYKITIQAKITKTITVNADDKDKAEEEAHQQFNFLDNGYYEQDTLSIEES